MIYNRKFNGIIPKIESRILPDGFGEKVVDANLESGTIKPWPCPEIICDKEDNIVSIHDNDTCECLTWNSDISIVDYIAGGCRFKIWTENGIAYIATPQMLCNGESCKLGVPCPNLPPGGTGSSFVFTWVNQFGQESSPSPLGNSQTLTETPPDGYCIVSARFYEIQSGWKGGDESKTDLGSAALLVSEILLANPGSPTNYIGAKQLDTYRYFLPPTGINCLQVMKNGALVTFKGKRLYFSEPPALGPAPHAWSGEHDIELDFDIVGLIVDDNRLYVGTCGNPYVVTIETPRTGDYFYSEIKIAEDMPLASKKSLALTGDGVLMLSTEGIGLLSGAAGSIISHGHFTRKQWKDLRPETGKAVALDGKYIFSTNVASYIFFYGSRSHNHSEELTPLSELTLIGRPNDLIVSKDKTILFDFPSDPCSDIHDLVMEWDVSQKEVNCLKCCNYMFLSKVYVMPSPDNPGAFKLSFNKNEGPLNFVLYTDDCKETKVVHRKLIHDCNSHRLPSGYRRTDFQYEITGCAELHEFHMARSVTELAQRPGA